MCASPARGTCSEKVTHSAAAARQLSKAEHLKRQLPCKICGALRCSGLSKTRETRRSRTNITGSCKDDGNSTFAILTSCSPHLVSLWYYPGYLHAPYCSSSATSASSLQTKTAIRKLMKISCISNILPNFPPSNESPPPPLRFDEASSILNFTFTPARSMHTPRKGPALSPGIHPHRHSIDRLLNPHTPPCRTYSCLACSSAPNRLPRTEEGATTAGCLNLPHLQPQFHFPVNWPDRVEKSINWLFRYGFSLLNYLYIMKHFSLFLYLFTNNFHIIYSTLAARVVTG